MDGGAVGGMSGRHFEGYVFLLSAEINHRDRNGIANIFACCGWIIGPIGCLQSTLHSTGKCRKVLGMAKFFTPSLSFSEFLARFFPEATSTSVTHHWWVKECPQSL